MIEKICENIIHWIKTLEMLLFGFPMQSIIELREIYFSTKIHLHRLSLVKKTQRDLAIRD